MSAFSASRRTLLFQFAGMFAAAVLAGFLASLLPTPENPAGVYPDLAAAASPARLLGLRQIAAVSAGIVDQTPCLDLCYEEDSRAQVDMNFVMDDALRFTEIQGTGEGRTFSRDEMDQLTDLGEVGCRELMDLQLKVLGDRRKWIAPPRTIVLASDNPHKVRELKDMLGEKYRVLTMSEAGCLRTALSIPEDEFIAIFFADDVA